MTTRPLRWPWLLLVLSAVLAAGWWLRPRPVAPPVADPAPRAAADDSPGIRAADPAAVLPHGASPPLLPLPLADLLVPEENRDWLEQSVWHVPPRGHDVELADVPFWIDGLLQLHGPDMMRDGRRFRQQVAVPVPAEHAAHPWRTLHLLGGATGYIAPQGTRVAEVVWHYAAGAPARSPLEYGVHLRDWWGPHYEDPPRVTDPHSRCVWRADHPDAALHARQLRLYLVSLANPRPGRPLRAVEIAHTGRAPTLLVLGLTLDELPPGARGAGFEDLDALRPGLTDVQSVFVLEAGTDRPVAGAEVRATFEELPRTPGGRGAIYPSTAVTGADGHAAVPRAAPAAGYVRLSAQAAGYAAAEQAWRAAPGAPIPDRLVLRLERGFSIGGVVLGPDDVPVSGATVHFLELNRGPGPAPDDRPRPSIEGLQATTDAEGRWSTDRLPAALQGDLSLHAAHPDYLTPKVLPRLGAEEHRQLAEHRHVLRLLAGAVVQGLVLGPGGQPFAGAQVAYRGGPGYPQVEPRETTSGPDGRFVLTRVPPAWPGPVTATAEGYSPAARLVEPKEGAVTEVTLQLEEAISLGGVVVDPEGQPVPGVRVQPMTSEFDREGGLQWDALTDEEGRFLWRDAPRWPVRFCFRKEGHSRLCNVTLEPGREDHVVRLPWLRRVEGQVLDDGSGEPVRRFRIKAVQQEGDWVHDPSPFTGPEFTAEAGRFTLELEDADRNALQVTAEGYEAKVEPLPEAARGVVRVTIRLEPLETDEGRVVDLAGRPVPGVTVLVTGGAGFEGATLHRGRLRPHFEAEGVAITDAEGRFRPRVPAQPRMVIAAGDEGFGEMTWALFQQSPILVLQPWGAIEAVTRLDGQPAAGEVWLLNFGTAGHRGESVQASPEDYRAVSDTEGRFLMERVPPGRRALVQLVPLGDGRWMQANETPVDVLPGETTQIELGTLGALVRGRLDAGAAAGQPDLMLRVNLAPPKPAMPVFTSQADARAWAAQPEVQAAFQAAARQWQALAGPDGGFALRDVPPGRYTLTAVATVPSEEVAYRRREIARVEVPVEVGESTHGSPPRLDLGVLRLAPVHEPKP